MQVDTHLIAWGTGLAISGLGFARGYSVAEIKLGSLADFKGHIGTAFQYMATLVGTGLTWWGTYSSSKPMLEKQDFGTAVAMLQATAAAEGVFYGLIGGAAVGFVFRKLFGQFLD